MADDQTQMIAQLTYGLESLTRAVESLQTELREHSQRHNTFATRFVAIESTLRELNKLLDQINKLVRDGNGQPSLMHQLIEVQLKIKSMLSTVNDLEQSFGVFQTAKVVTRGQIWTGISTAVITVVLAIVTLVAQMLLR